MKLLAINLAVLGLLISGCDSTKQTTDRVDNSAMNQRDRNDSSKTPLDQNENSQDIDTTAKIRRQVVDSQMSSNAKNIKIITQAGNVTLRGPVPTEEEKTKIEMIAREVAGEAKVTNQIDVSSSK